MRKKFSSKRITELRETWGLSVAEFAKRIGKSRQLVAQWESGHCKPNLDSLIDVCHIFDAPLEYFFVKNNVNVHQEKNEIQRGEL